MADSGAVMALPSNPDEDAGPKIIGVTVFITSLALLTYSTRMYVRLFMVRNLGWDDYIMSLAVALVVTGQGFIIASVKYGAGRHMGDIPMEDIPKGVKLNFITQPIYLWAICIVKLAVGATLLRIASTTFYKRLIVGIMAFMTFYTTGCFFTVVLQCTDIRVLWDTSIQATCWGQKTLQGLSYTNVALNILTDLCFAVFIPIPMLWNLNVNTRTRLSLMGALGLGFFACAAAFVKISSLVNYGKLGDWLWDSRDITIWTTIECNAAIVAGSLPALRPIFKSILGTSLGYGPSTGGQKGGSGMGYFRGGTHGDHHELKSATRGGKMGGIHDETSSERAFNAATAFEMGGTDRHHNKTSANTTVFADPDALSSDESLPRQHPIDHANNGRKGITKTTTTTVDYAVTK